MKIMNSGLRAAIWVACSATVFGGSINFDDQATASSGISSISLTNQYASQGVLFSSMDASQSFKFNITPTSSPNYATPFWGSNSTGFITFVDPTNSSTAAWVSSVSFELLGLTSTVAHPGNFSGVTIDALDLGGNVIAGDTQVIPATTTTTSNQFLTFTGQVHQLRFTYNSGSGLDPIDDLSFGTVNPTPEPSTWLLAGAGLVAVGLIRRRS